MSIVVRHSPISLTTATYDSTIKALDAAGGAWPPGRDYHVCFGTDGSLHVSEIDSKEQFGERLMPILADAGIEFSGPPEIFEVHNSNGMLGVAPDSRCVF